MLHTIICQALKKGHGFQYKVKVIPTVITNYLRKYSQWQPFKQAYSFLHA